MPARPPASLTQQLVGLGDHVHTRAQPLSVDTGAIQDDAVTAAKLNNDVYATTVTTIDPDDTAASGTVGGQLAPFDHQHPITTGTPAALTLTATSAESAGTGFARDVHVHSTNALPWGVVGTPQVQTGNSAGFTADDTTADFQLTGIAVSDTRRYVVCLTSDYQITPNPGRWLVNLHVGGTLTNRLWDIDHEAGASNNGWVNARRLWLPSTGTFTLDVGVDEITDGSTLTFTAAATATRDFWVEDIGPR